MVYAVQADVEATGMLWGPGYESGFSETHQRSERKHWYLIQYHLPISIQTLLFQPQFTKWTLMIGWPVHNSGPNLFLKYGWSYKKSFLNLVWHDDSVMFGHKQSQQQFIYLLSRLQAAFLFLENPWERMQNKLVSVRAWHGHSHIMPTCLIVLHFFTFQRFSRKRETALTIYLFSAFYMYIPRWKQI